MFDQQNKDEYINKTAIQPNTGSVSSFYARALFDYLHSIHIDPKLLFEPALIEALNNSGSRIPISHWHMMFERAIAYTNDVDLPLKVAEQIQPKHLGMLGFAIMSSRNLSDVISILLRYEQLIDDVNSTHLVDKGDSFELHWLPLIDPSLPTFMQLALVCWVVMSRQITSRHDITFDAHFSFNPPAQQEIYQRIFGGKVYFNAPITKLIARKSMLDLPITLSDPATNRLLMTQVEKNLQSLTQPDLLQQLRAYITANLASNQVSITDTASALDIYPRALQYQLSAYGLNYSSFLEKIRQEQAEHFLRTTDLSLNEIAFLLGYSEQSPFQKAFRRWTGESPGSFRKKFGV